MKDKIFLKKTIFIYDIEFAPSLAQMALSGMNLKSFVKT